MPENISNAEGAVYNLEIPSFDENADIQTAFRTYHYGEGRSGDPNNTPFSANSIAGFLDALEQAKIDGTATFLPGGANLNNYTTPGYYVQTSDASAQTGSNYPKFPPDNEDGLERAGLLKVISDGNNHFQEYHLTGLVNNRAYWRSFFGAIGWSPWKSFADYTHTHDDRYYQRGEIDSIFIPTIKYKTIRSVNLSGSSYTLTKNDEDCIILVNGGSLPNSIVIPENTTNALLNIQVGASFRIIQANTGQTEVTPINVNVNLSSTPGTKLRELWSVVTLTKIATNQWVLTGDLEDDKTNLERKAAIGIYVQATEPIVGVRDGDLWFW